MFIDLQKTFDTVDHNILFDKLNYYGARGTTNSWFRSCLCNRKQIVSINGLKSNSKVIKYGVPQGFVLGPLLFLIYINELYMSTKNSSVHHFADDTNLLYINKSLNNIGSRINSDLKGLTDWLNANRISFNISKTEFILFQNRNKTIHYDLKIKLNGKRIFPTTSVKYLGVIFNENLSWMNHLTALSAKLSRANSMLCKVPHFVDKQPLRSIYYAIFSSHLTYGSLIWGQQDNPNISKIISLQKNCS